MGKRAGASRARRTKKALAAGAAGAMLVGAAMVALMSASPVGAVPFADCADYGSASYGPNDVCAQMRPDSPFTPFGVLTSAGNWGGQRLDYGNPSFPRVGICIDPFLAAPDFDDFGPSVDITVVGSWAGPLVPSRDAKIAYLLNKYLYNEDPLRQAALSIYVRHLANNLTFSQAVSQWSSKGISRVLDFEHPSNGRKVQTYYDEMVLEADAYAGEKEAYAAVDIQAGTVSYGLQREGQRGFLPGYAATVTLSPNAKFVDNNAQSHAFTTGSAAASAAIAPVTTWASGETVRVTVSVAGVQRNFFQKWITQTPGVQDLYYVSNNPVQRLATLSAEAEDAMRAAIGTTAVDKADGDHILPQGGGTITDTVAYTGLTEGTQYRLDGTLMDKATGQSTGIVASRTFTPTTSDGEVTLDFAVPAPAPGATFVVFEELYDVEGTLVASHEDIEDEGQTIRVPAVGTTAVDKADGDHYLPQSGGTITDTVAYSNLIEGRPYRVEGTLMDKATGQSTGIVASTTFTPTSPSGEVTVEFEVPPLREGGALVVFEKVYDVRAEVLMARHEDIDDEGQTVLVPRIGTTAIDAADGDHFLTQAGGVIEDTVAYTNLLPGAKYTVSGELVRKSTGEPTGITGSASFTASASGSGTVVVELRVPAGVYDGDGLVAFEDLYDVDGELTAWHRDVDDVDQTVSVPSIGTTAVDAADGDHALTSAGGVIEDTVAYTNLVPGGQYTVSGELVRKSTGELTGIKGTASFTASATGSGAVVVELTVPAGVYAGDALVAFEEIYDANSTLTAWHRDLEDADQTVDVGRAPIGALSTPTIQAGAPGAGTSSHAASWPLVTAGAASMMAAAALLLLLTLGLRRRRS